MNIDETIRRRFEQHAEIMRQTLEQCAEPIARAAELLIEAYRNGGGVFLFGNGGSAADAQHIAGELVGRFLRERKALRAQALSTDTSVLTALANDYDYDRVFVRQLEANARPGDVAFALSTSGNSPNVVAALNYARANGLSTVALTGAGGGDCAAHADVLIAIPAEGSPRVQEAGMLAYHVICEIVEQTLAET
jgi:D-sedoheptulose 7-phosphate isomerase